MRKRKPWPIAGMALATALSLATIAPDAVRGSYWAWLLIVLVLAVPVATAVEIADLRRAGKHELADALLQWSFGLAVTVLLVVFLDQARISDARLDCLAEPKPEPTEPLE